jgi:predicted transposase/invertase (TIGR01784 family)
MAEQRKPLRELDLADDFLFAKVMEDADILRDTLSLLLNKKIVRVESANVQQVLQATYESKGVRLDVCATDSDGTIYDVEMQRSDQRDLPLRSRYYQSALDLDRLEKGGSYSDLHETYIIFICLFDFFGAGRHVYTFSNRCAEDPTLEFGDGAKKIVVNAHGTRDDASPTLKRFLHYLEHSTEATAVAADDDLLHRIADKIHVIKTNQKMEVEYMHTWMLLADQRAEGAIERAIEIAINMIARFHHPLTDVMSTVNLSPEYRQTVVDKLQEKGIAYTP